MKSQKKRNKRDAVAGASRPVAPPEAPVALPVSLGPGPVARREWIVLASILLTGLILRAVYLSLIMQAPDFAHPALDPQFNDYWARAMVTGDWTPPEGYPDPLIRMTPHGRPPGYPYVLAAVYRCFGLSYVTPRVLQMGLGLANVVLMFFLARRLFGRFVALVAAGFMATYWIFIHFEGELTYPVFVIAIALTMAHALCAWVRKPGAIRALSAGLLLGAFALFRPNVVLFGPALVVWFAWVLWPTKAVRAWFLSSLLLTVGVVAMIAPPLIRNYVVADDFVFLSSYGGVNLWAGNNANSDCVTPKIPHLKEIAGFEDWTCFHYPTIVHGVGRVLGKDNIKFSEASRYFYDQAIDFIVHHPLETLRLTLTRALIFWGPTETTNDRVLHWEKRNSPLLRWMPGFPAVMAVFVLGTAALVQAWRAGRARDQRERFALHIVLFVFIATYFASVMPYFVAGRYRIPVIPFLLMIGAVGVRHVVRKLAARDYKSAAIWLAAGAAIWGVDSIQFYSYVPDLAIWHHQRMIAYEQKGEIEHALDEAKAELVVNPQYADGHVSRGRLLIELGRVDEGIAEYREAVRIKPDNDIAWNNLGFELVRKGSLDEALRCYDTALGVNPRLPIAHNNLGNLLIELGKPGEAIAHFQEALKVDPLDKYADYNWANALAALGRSGEALEHFQRALTLYLGNADVPNNLGLALAQLGRSDEAIASYEAALRIDPKYANAYNNIGFEYFQRNDFVPARKAYDEALRLKPDFGLARNNLGRLLARQGDKQGAMAQFEQALAADPKDKNAYLNIGDSLAGEGRFDEAIDRYRKAFQNDPFNADIPNNLAIALTKTGRVDEAMQFYRAALRINPKYVKAYCNLGIILLEAGQIDEAAQLFNQALAVDPSCEPARAGLERAKAVKARMGLE